MDCGGDGLVRPEEIGLLRLGSTFSSGILFCSGGILLG